MVKLAPVELSSPASVPHSEHDYALITRDVMANLAHLMDSRSAILFCLTWEAVRNLRMSYGPYAGQQVARISAQTLTHLSGKPIRTVRWALAWLRNSGAIIPVNPEPGKVSVYRISALSFVGQNGDAVNKKVSKPELSIIETNQGTEL